MRKRVALVLGAAGAITLLAPVAATVTASAASAPPACVVVTGPSGLNLQVGYAPNGPSDCRRIP
jgi:hypothetical protein